MRKKGELRRGRLDRAKYHDRIKNKGLDEKEIALQVIINMYCSALCFKYKFFRTG